MTEYSHSRLTAYEDCPRKFRYRYVDEIKVESEGVEAFVGKRVHEILERLYHHVGRFGRPPSLAQVLDRFRQDWARAWHDKVTIVRAENPAEFYQERGARCLENFYRAHYPFSDGETLGLEQRLRLSLDGDGRYRAIGIVDRIARRGDGVFEIHDYKTGAYLPPQRRLDEDRQLAMYQIGLEQTYPEAREVELVWHYLAFNKTLRSRRTPEALEQLRGEVVRLIDAIEAETQYPARPGPLCRWCDYSDLCPDAPAEARAVAKLRAPSAPEPLLASGGMQQLALLLE
ncbi:MAG: RecB family exonuclease [Myxococcota bacterium]